MEAAVTGNPNAMLNKQGQQEGIGNKYAALSWLTGAGLLDTSKPNYKKQAQFEQKDRARAQREAMRNGGG